jgi:hypothetical protein
MGMTDAEVVEILRDIASRANYAHTHHAAEAAATGDMLWADLRDRSWDTQQAAERGAEAIEEVARLREALTGILEIGKRDMSNPKYDGYFDTARAALSGERKGE